jgi:transposase
MKHENRNEIAPDRMSLGIPTKQLVHRDNLIYRNAFDEPKPSRRNVNRPLSVIKRIGLIGAARSELARELRGVLSTGKLMQNPCPIVLGIALTATGIGETSALQILGELAVLPDTLDARQWVAFSGLDPGSSNRGNRSRSAPGSVGR